MKISACSIVKNEAHNIARSIESYKDAVDEIIIVDTGSTDNTVEICKKYGARVLHFDWCNNFAAAKNYALDNAKGNWILFLDADEWFVPTLKKSQLRNIINKVDIRQDGILTTMCDLEEDNKIRLRGVTNRIFRGSPAIRFHGSIHEKILRDGNKLALNRRLDIEIYHCGYIKGTAKLKAERNIELLNHVYNKGEIDTELYFYLFRENCYLKNIDEAIKFFDMFFQQEDADKLIQDKDAVICIFETMYNTMLLYPEKFSQDDIDRITEMAYTRYPGLPIHSYMLGAEMLKKGDLLGSFKYLNQAISLNSEYKGTFTNKFIGYMADAYYKLGYIKHRQGFDGDALSCYMDALKIASYDELVVLLPKIINIIEYQPQDEIVFFLNSVIDISKKENIECILGALKKTRLHKAFIYYALKYNRDFDGQDDTTYIAMILSGQAGLAIETAIKAFQNISKLNTSNVQEGNNIKWHIDYALVGILFLNNYETYEKYKQYFSEDQKIIIEAYLDNRKIIEVSEQLKAEFEKIYSRIFYLFEINDVEKFKNLM